MRLRNIDWLPWFAWRPVQVPSRKNFGMEWVWLRWIERKWWVDPDPHLSRNCLDHWLYYSPPKTKWHAWFAWYPIYTAVYDERGSEMKLIWLRWIERRWFEWHKTTKRYAADLSHWQHRETANDA